MSSTKIDFLYLNEEEMVKAGVTDMHRCVEVMGEVFDLMGRGDYVTSRNFLICRKMGLTAVSWR